MFFFFISNKYIYSRTLPYAEDIRQREKYKGKEREKRKKKGKDTNYTRELRNKGNESLEVNPQALDQSNREPPKEANSWSSELSMSSHVLLFRSLQRQHIKHNGAKFQMLDACFPGQFHQPNRVTATDLGKTQEIPKDLNTKDQTPQPMSLTTMKI